MKRIGIILAIAGLLLMIGPAAFAEETTCRRTFGATTLDNVRVPDGATCTLEGTRVKGTIYVETGSRLRAIDVYVIGNVQAEDSALVVVRGGSVVGESVQVVQGGSARVLGSRINGDILFDEQSGALRAERNRIGGNLQAFQNTGGVTIIRNRIDGNLQCKANNPPPTGYGNIVQGEKEDQCKRL